MAREGSYRAYQYARVIVYRRTGGWLDAIAECVKIKDLPGRPAWAYEKAQKISRELSTETTKKDGSRR